MSDLPNQALVWKRFREGDQPAFSVLYRHHYASLYFYALKSTGSTYQAQECVQDLFVNLWNRREGLSEVQQVKPYLFKALRSLLHRRSMSTYEDLNSEEGNYALQFSPEDFLIQRESSAYRQETLATVLNGLPPRQREAVYLKYYEDLTYQEIADVLSINYQSVVNLIYRALKQLKQQPTLRKLITQYHWVPLLLGSWAGW
ncbi:MAG: sigma-70 family RNA polymerase sigma factor [Tunicatimonas sp.]